MKVLRTAVQVVGAIATVASFIPGPHQGIAAIVAAVATAASAALTVTAPKPSRQGSPTDFKSDPQAGSPYMIGRTANAGNIVHRETWGEDNKYQGFAVVWGGGGPYEQLEAFQVDRATVAFGAGGAAVGGTYGAGDNAPWMWLRTQLGATPEAAALASPVAGFPGWGAASKLSGYAAGLWVLKFDKKGKKFAAGTPAPLAIFRGAKVYDPRQDSTYPGGAGACRAGNEATYVGGAAAENPYCHALTWALGRWHNAKRVMGIGMAIASIDVPSFVDAMNVADANGWKAGGTVNSLDDKWNVLKLMCQAGGGEPMRLGAKLSVLVSAPRVSIITVQSSDLIGPGRVVATQSRRERINTVIPRVRLESHGWQMVPLNPVTNATYVGEDGGTRTRERQFDLVQDRDQGAELAAYEIVNAREFGPITLPLRIRFIGIKPGDCVTVNIPEMGLNNQPVIILQRALDPETAAVTLAAKSETPAKHPFALGRTGVAPPTPNLIPIDLANVPAPAAGSWVAVSFTLFGPSGSSPAIMVSGVADNAGTEAVVFEYRVNGTADWQAAGTEQVGTLQKIIAGLAPGQTYQVAVSYQVRGVVGARLVLGPVTVAGASATTFEGAGDLATLDSVYFNSPLVLEGFGGSQATLSNFRTNLGTAAAIAGQGALATVNQASYTTQISGYPAALNPGNLLEGGQYIDAQLGRYLLTGGATVPMSSLRPAEFAANVTETRTASAIAGQGALATRNLTRLGIETGDETGTIMARHQLANNRSENGTGHIAQPAGGAVDYSGGNITGAFKIRLPSTYVLGTMIRFRFEIFDYSGPVNGSSLVLNIGGYIYDPGGGAAPSWHNVAAELIGRQTGRDLRVIFGLDADGRPAIWIGATTSLWAYPKAVMRDFMFGHASNNIVYWEAGWAVSIVGAAPASIVYQILTPVPGESYFGNNVRDALGVATQGGYRTAEGTAAAIAGQGALATINAIQTDSHLSGTLATRLAGHSLDTTYLRASRTLYDNAISVEGYRPQEVNSNRTETRTAAAIAGQGAMATRAYAQLGDTIRDTAGNVLSDNQVRNSQLLESNAMAVVAQPAGAAGEFSGVITGGLGVKLPVAAKNTYTMISFRVQVFEYGTAESCEYQIAGYMFNGADERQWFMLRANYTGPQTNVRPVRFGYDSVNGRGYIIIGANSTQWDYPKAIVRDVMVGHQFASLGIWETGWDITWEAAPSFTQYDQVANPVPGDATFGINTRDSTGVATQGGYRTAEGTAAAIAGQGALATANAATWGAQVSGRPAELTDGRVAAALTSVGRLVGAEALHTAAMVGIKNTNDVALTATDAGGSATISVPAHERKVPGSSGTVTRTYNSGSIVGLLHVTRYFVYTDDPTFAGGALTYVATTDSDVLAGGAGRVYVGEITTPAIGGGGTGGGTGGVFGGGGGGGGVYP